MCTRIMNNILLNFVIISLFLICINTCTGKFYPIARTPIGLDKWTTLEIDLLDNLEILKLESRNISFIDDLETYKQDFYDTVKNLKDYQGSLEARVQAITANPVASLRMLRRLAYELPELRHRMSAYSELFAGFPSLEKWLSYKDVDDAMMGILRISMVYNFKAEKVAKGIFGEIHTGAKLYALHCHEIAIHAGVHSFHDLAIEWAELAFKKASYDKTIPRTLLRPVLQELMNNHDQDVQKPPHKNYPHSFDQKLAPIQSKPNYFKLRRKMREVLEEKYSGKVDVAYNDINYRALCTHGDYQTAEEKSQLFCWHDFARHPYWTIGPLKLEMLSKDPDILQVYDIIGDKKIKRLQELGSATLKISSVIDNASENKSKSVVKEDIRTSVNGWVNEHRHPELLTLPLTIEKITGLKVLNRSAGEILQVAAYTFSGHYDVHLDATLTDVLHGNRFGDRIATFMYYLHEPELGGYTAFPQGKTAARPVKGSGVFWYDTYSDMEADKKTYHGACPVVLGRKWVANKWIRYYDQFINHKCGLLPKKRYYMDDHH